MGEGVDASQFLRPVPELELAGREEHCPLCNPRLHPIVCKGSMTSAYKLPTM